MAYCRTLTFTAKFKGEGVISRLVCDALELRKRINERVDGIKRYTASEVLEAVCEFSTEKTDDTDEHYFIVELGNINRENKSLLEYEGVKNYLSLNAPVPYGISFDPFGAQINEHAKKLGFEIDEYDIFLNGEQLFKPYTLTYPTKLGGDEISGIEFREIRDERKNIIAWMWFGLSCFRGIIEKGTLMRGIRLRKGNIQIGDETALQKFFPEERGNCYFVGELFCISDGLVPNSRRDYFNENPECAYFESKMFARAVELTDIYRKASEIRNCRKRIKQAEDSATEIKYRLVHDYFKDDADREQAKSNLKQAEEESAKDKQKIESISSSSELFSKIAGNIERKGTYFTGVGGKSPSKYSQNELKLLARVFGIISNELGGKYAADLIQQIKEELCIK